jgi:23S rRNA (adenine2503-C2)-methyltransferase
MQTNNLDRNYLLDYSRDEIRDYVQHMGMAPYRADQLMNGIYVQNLADFSELTTFSKSLRTMLKNKTTLRTFELLKIIKSDRDKTTKFLWSLTDGLKIESVIIYEKNRVTFCISSQVGCALDCQFCATGKMGYLRNLSSGEIVEQVLLMLKKTERKATNIVFMGMGEPLLNLKNVIKACYIFSDPLGMAFAQKKITISTSGIAPAVRKLADMNAPFSLAVSLNAVFEDKRKELMPVSENYPLPVLLNNIQYYVSTTGKRVTFEYILIDGVNDSKKDADQLIKLTGGLPCKINLIPCNSEDPKYPPTPDDRAKWFADYLHQRGKTSTVRLRKGWEIQAACGQLYTQNENRSGSKITDLR